MRLQAVMSSFLLLAGCASTEVNYNALDIASTNDSLLTKQVVYNLIRTYENKYAIPAYTRIATQTAQTTDSFNPTFSTPFNAQTTLMQSATSALTSKALQTAGSGLSLQLQANRQQNYTLSPVVDPDQLRRLRSIFQYAAGQIGPFEFETDYPIISVSGAGSSQQKSTVTLKMNGSTLSLSTGGGDAGKPEVTYLRRACDLHPPGLKQGPVQDRDGRCLYFHYIEVHPDKTFIALPGCIMCDVGATLPSGPPNNSVLIINPKLFGHICHDADYLEKIKCKDEDDYTLFYKPGENKKPDAIQVESNGIQSLSLRGEQGLQQFYELALFAQEASSQGTGSPSSGGQSDGRKTPALQTFSGPAGGVTNLQ